MKYVEAFPVSSTDAITTAKTLVSGVICRYGLPLSIICDNGPAFANLLLASLTAELGIKQIHVSPRHPQANGDVESVNKVINQTLKIFANESHTNWDVELPWAIFAYNTHYHSLTMETPFFMNHGRDPHLPIDVMLNRQSQHQTHHMQYSIDLVNRLTQVHSRVAEILKQAQEERIGNQPKLQLQVGDEVYLHDDQGRANLATKFLVRYKGPYVVIDKVSSVNYTILKNGKSHTVHIERLRKVMKNDNIGVTKSDLTMVEEELEVLNNRLKQLIETKTNLHDQIDYLISETSINEHQ